MHVIVIGDSETSVGDIAERLYGGLSAEARQHAEQALLRANPQLAETGALRTGAAILTRLHPVGSANATSESPVRVPARECPPA